MEITDKLKRPSYIAKRVGKKGKELSDSVKRALRYPVQLRLALTIIEDRTAEGRADQRAGSCAIPCEEYTWFRAKNGVVCIKYLDLQFTGKMLGSMTTRANGRQAEIFFTRTAEAKKAAMNNKTRPFFGFSRSEEERLGKVFFRNLK